jgi:hypothetical protein
MQSLRLGLLLMKKTPNKLGHVSIFYSLDENYPDIVVAAVGIRGSDQRFTGVLKIRPRHGNFEDFCFFDPIRQSVGA